MKKRAKRPTWEEGIKKELEETKRALEAAHSNFENVLDPDLIDCYIYEVNAAQHRYTFLLKQLKERQVLQA